MKFSQRLFIKTTHALVALMALFAFGQASASTVYDLSIDGTGGLGAPSYGTVTLTAIGSDVQIFVDLRDDLSFFNGSGAHTSFAFNNTVAGLSVTLPSGWATAAGVPPTNPPFNNFMYGFDTTNVGQNTATFLVLGTTEAAFHVLSTRLTGHGGTPAYFSADVIKPAFGTAPAVTGAIGSVGLVPEPDTYAMILAGLGMIGFIGRRRLKNLS